MTHKFHVYMYFRNTDFDCTENRKTSESEYFQLVLLQLKILIIAWFSYFLCQSPCLENGKNPYKNCAVLASWHACYFSADKCTRSLVHTQDQIFRSTTQQQFHQENLGCEYDTRVLYIWYYTLPVVKNIMICEFREYTLVY